MRTTRKNRCRSILLVLLLIICISATQAQKNSVKKDIAQAQAFIKSKKNYDKAEQLMMNLLKDSINVGNLRIRSVLVEAIQGQYEQSNEKMYLHQRVDTTALFLLTMRMFMQTFALDSVDALPDEKGRVRIKHRSKNAAYLDKYRKNLFSGGAYFIKKQRFDDAYTFMDTYLECSRQPLFSAYSYPLDPVAAYWALYSAYKTGSTHRIMKYAELAQRDTTHLEYTLQYLADTYHQIEDTAQYVATLHEGFLRYKLSPYFFTHLIDHYTACRMPNSALDIADIALAEDPHNDLFLYAKSNILLDMGQYDACIAICDTIIACNDTIAEAYYNAGAAWINKAFMAEREDISNAKKRQRTTAAYRAALPYMERYRLLKPEEKDKWAAALYNIYLNLNMGREFQEIDRMLR